VEGVPFLDPLVAPVVETGSGNQPTPEQLPSAPVRAALTAGGQVEAGLVHAPAAAPYEPTLDEIAERAYQIYQRRGGVHGKDMDDWLEAERQLREEHRGKA
jgi:hypothetical protein